MNIIDDETLRVAKPEYNTKVQVGAVISHEVYENYAKRYADDEVYGPKFAKLANQTVTVSLNVIGEKGEEPTTTEETTTQAPTTDISATETTSVDKASQTTVGKNNNVSKKKLTIKKVKVKKLKKKIRITWKKNTYSTGYVVKFKKTGKSKKYKTVVLKSNKKTKYYLKKKYKYTFKIRAYKLANKKKVYGRWKTIKIKK